MINNSVTKHPNEGKVMLHNSKYGLCRVNQHESKPVTFILTKNMNKKEALFKYRWGASYSNKLKCENIFYISYKRLQKNSSFYKNCNESKGISPKQFKSL